MPSIYEFNHKDGHLSNSITVISKDGSRFRIFFDAVYGGFLINKTNDDGGSETITVQPSATNQIRVK